MQKKFTTHWLKPFFIAILIILCAGSMKAAAPISTDIKKETYAYDGNLYLDRYYCTNFSGSQANIKEKSPVMIFMFGGAFYTGSRDRKDYIPYFHYLAEHGIQVFSIDYRLGLKPFVDKMQGNTTEQDFPTAVNNGRSQGKLAVAKQMIGLMEKSIDMAVEDLYKATAYIISNAEKWNIDTALIMTSGSSAGAITALQAEYYLSNQFTDESAGEDEHTLPTKYLPSGFKYGGVISFAGAILNLHSKMKWDKTPAPIMFFHGNADSNVPYNRIWTPMGCFNGSKYISKKLSKMDAPHYLYTYEEANHSIAVTPMLQNLPEILGFIEDFVYSGKKYITNTIVEQPFAPELKKRLRIKDYIKANL